MQKIESVKTRVAFNTDLKISTWVPHHEFCNICYGRSGGTKKVKSQGRPRNDITHLSREMMRAVNTINPPKYTDLTLYSSLFLKSPFLDDLLCQHCKCIPNQPLELIPCRHLICISCISKITESRTLICT